MFDIQSLSVAYGTHIALQDVSLSVEPGVVVAVIGPNGAGKTTLIRAVSGVQSVRSGSITIDGRDLAQLSSMERARHLTVVAQARQMPGAFTVYQTVLMGRTPYMGWLGQADKTDHTFVRLALERTQTQAFANRRVGELSGGEQQRVLLARALAQNTPILLLDEPTTFLDLRHQSNFLNLVRDLAARDNLVVLMTLHDLNLTALYADRVILLVDGRVYAEGTPKQVLTAKNLTAVYNVPVHVIPHPDYGTPLILPDGCNPGPEQIQNPIPAKKRAHAHNPTVLI